MASIIFGDMSSKTRKHFLLLDVQQLSVGIETHGGYMTKIIQRNSSVPAKKTKIFATYSLPPSSYEEHGYTDSSDPLPICDMPIKVYCGERSQVKINYMIGIINMTGNSSKCRRIEVTLDVDARF